MQSWEDNWRWDDSAVFSVLHRINVFSLFTNCMNQNLNIRLLVTGEKKTIYYAAAVAELLQSCPTLCDPIDGSPLGSPVPGILQARTLEWVAISFSNAWKWKVKVKSLSGVRLFETPWTAAHQAPPSMGFSRQEYWSGVPSPSPIVRIFQIYEGYLSFFINNW